VFSWPLFCLFPFSRFDVRRVPRVTKTSPAFPRHVKVVVHSYTMAHPVLSTRVINNSVTVCEIFGSDANLKYKSFFVTRMKIEFFFVFNFYEVLKYKKYSGSHPGPFSESANPGADDRRQSRSRARHDSGTNGKR
jgi:hypothetical protein